MNWLHLALQPYALQILPCQQQQVRQKLQNLNHSFSKQNNLLVRQFHGTPFSLIVAVSYVSWTIQLNPYVIIFYN